MNLTLVMVASVDGKSTHAGEEGTHQWNSEEDKMHFQKVLENGKLFIMGSSTYEGARESMTHDKERLRVVITRDPSKYEHEKIPNKLEFTNDNPKQILQDLESRGFTEGFLLGGANTNTEFFKQNLINEIWLTLEPRVLGKGNGLMGEEKVNVKLKLLSTEKLNDQGTLLLKYSVIN